MRTTLDIDIEVLSAVKELAKRQGKTAGQAVSELLRDALLQRSNHQVAEAHKPYVTGFEPFDSRGGIVTNELINDLRDEVGD